MKQPWNLLRVLFVGVVAVVLVIGLALVTLALGKRSALAEPPAGSLRAPTFRLSMIKQGA